MKNLIQGQKNWADFEIKGKIGVIATLFTEQYLEKTYSINQINHKNFEVDIELNNIETVFIDNDLFESDHQWYKKNRGAIINYLKNNNKTIIVIQNTTKEIASIFKRSFILKINHKEVDYKNHGHYLEAPLLVNESYHNPNSSKSKTDIVYLNIATRAEKKSHNLNFEITTLHCTSVNISREILNNLFGKLKTSKILYINFSKLLDDMTLKYIELIATLNSTYVIYDYKFSKNKSDLKVYAQSTTDNIIYTLLSNPQFHLKKVISKQRMVLINNTMIIKSGLENFLTNMENNKAYISVITPTNRKQNLLAYIERINAQESVELDVIIVTHGFELVDAEIQSLKNNFKHKLRIIYRDAEVSLGQCLNAAIELTEYPIIAKVDDDDYYYKNYLLDQWLALKYSNADLVGKSASFYYFEKDDLFVLRRLNDHSRFCDHIMGATIMSPAHIMKNLMFSDLPRAVDSDYIKRLKESDGIIYASHPYEMCVYRAKDISKHTWSVDDMSLYRHAKVMGYGDPKVFVEVN